MSLAAFVAWAVFAVLIAWLGMVLYATLHTIGGEVREATEGDDGPRDGP